MSEARTQQEPSMEEILASIRRIISEDSGEDDRAKHPAQTQPPPPPEEPPEPEPEPREEVLELTDVIEEEDEGDAPPLAPLPIDDPEPPFMPGPRSRAERRPMREDRDDRLRDDRLLSDDTEMMAGAAFARLTDTASGGLPLGGADRTLEDIVRDLLRPMLRDWLDEHLPAIVERAVEAEIERVGRNARRR